MNILITGGAGFIGSHLADKLKSYHQITILDSLTKQVHGENPNLEDFLLSRSDIHFIKGDVRNAELMDDLLSKNEAVVHLAAETGTAQSMYQIQHYYDVNVMATASIFNQIALKHKHIQKVVFASSRSVYGEGSYLLDGMNFVPSSRTIDQLKKLDWECKGPNGETLTLKPTSEESYTLPCSIYAATKLACEQMAGIVSEAYGIPIVCLRFQNVYGEGQSLKNPYTGIISIFSNRLRNNQSINIFEDGEESRDFIHVSDVVESIRLSLESTMKGFPILNIGSGIPTSVMAVASILKEKLNSQSEIRVSGDFRVGDIRHCYADMTRVVKILNFQPKIGIEQGLGFFCDWFIKQSPETDRSDDALKELANKGLARK